MQQLAMDSIAELFARDDKGAFYKLIQYYEPLLEQITINVDEALFMTRRLVVAHTRQSLARSFQQNDPSGARIYRNLSLVPKRARDVRLVKYGDEDYFYFCNRSEKVSFPGDLNPGYPEIGWDSALFMLERSSRHFDTLPDIVRDFLDELKQEPACRHFICRSTLYKILKHILGLKTISLESEYAVTNPEKPEFLEISQTDQELYAVRIKSFFRNEIKQRFVEKSKLDQKEATVYFEILDRYFEDLLMDGFAGKLPDYQAKSIFRDLEPDEWKNHRGRLEYLIKLSKTELQAQYLDEFPNAERMRIENI